MPPQKPEPWAGVRDASAWAGHAPQAPSSLKQRPELAGLSGPRDTVPESENCLTLNVWTRGLGGGGKVSTLLALPAARGLFHRAIVMSGSAVRLIGQERAGKLAEAVLKELGLTRNQLDQLQTIPFDRLIAAIGPAQKTGGPPALP